jgi:uncharacterized protein YecT (DUF1311 family)
MTGEPALDCENAMTQAAMTECAGRDYEAADKALNAAWQAAAGKARTSSAQEFDRLLDAQRKWLKYRDAQCLAENGSGESGGSMWPMLQSSCLAGLAQERTARLRSYISTER